MENGQQSWVTEDRNPLYAVTLAYLMSAWDAWLDTPKTSYQPLGASPDSSWTPLSLLLCCTGSEGAPPPCLLALSAQVSLFLGLDD